MAKRDDTADQAERDRIAWMEWASTDGKVRAWSEASSMVRELAGRLFMEHQDAAADMTRALALQLHDLALKETDVRTELRRALDGRNRRRKPKEG